MNIVCGVYGSGDFETASGEFSPYFPRVAKPKIEQSWGFDAVVYKQLELLWQRPFYVIKHTDGGTAIDPSCESSTHGLYWSADTAFLSHTVSASHGGKSLLKAFERQIDDCLPHLPKNYDIKVLIWHQGESDQSAADRYYDNLKAVIAHIRQHLVEKTGKRKYANLPVVCGTFSKESRQGCQQVADALYRLSREDKYFYVVEATDLPLLSDHLHFNARGAQILGQRVGGAIITANDNMGELAFLYVKVGVQSKGIGQSIWKAIESMHPEIEVWETCTPYFDRRNIHFYINRCGFHAVEFFNEHHPDPNMPDQFDQEDGLFKFEKRMI